MYVKRNIEEPPCNNCSCGQAKILHILSVFVELGIQHKLRMRHIVICDVPGSTTFFYIISKTTRFSK
jgi:hypothetical protein